MQSNATSVPQYLASLPPDRRRTVAEVRKVIRSNLPKGYKETMQYGMISYVIPLERYPETYNGQPLALASLASQKQHVSLYLNNVYADPGLRKWIASAFKARGKKLDMGKSCIRFKDRDDLPMDVVGQAVAKTSVDEMVALYESSRPPRTRGLPDSGTS